MKYRFFHIPVLAPEAAAESLNGFLGQHRILAVDRQFVADGACSFWALSVSYAETVPGSSEELARGRKAKVDYREVLNQQDFALYASLRSLRKALAEREGVPAYALFTNEQLAAMVQTRVRTASALAEIEGVGKARVEKYAAAFLQVLNGPPAAAGGGDAPDAD
jgi:superfamily II DNA helicase RecQ